MRLKIEFSANWIKKHGIETSPASALSISFNKIYMDTFECEEISFTQLEVSFNDAKYPLDMVLASIVNFMQKKYGVEDCSSILTISDITNGESFFVKKINLKNIEVDAQYLLRNKDQQRHSCQGYQGGSTYALGRIFGCYVV